MTPDDVRRYHLGSVLNGGGSTPNSNKRASAGDWLAAADAFYDASMQPPAGLPAIPIIWGSDAVHGHSNVYGATIFPHNIGLGAANDPDLLREIGAATALEMRATGLEWTFAPTLAVVRDDRWGRTYEGYSEDPRITARYAAAIVTGLQGAPGSVGHLTGDKIVATAKHYLGDGGTVGGRDQGDNIDDEADLVRLHAAGYPPAIEAGVRAVMASFSSWHGEKLHGHRYLLTTVLKERLGFTGFVVGDWNGHGQVRGCSNANCAAAFNAGIDMFMVPEDFAKLYENTLAQVRDGTISEARLDDAVRRILRVKKQSGLFEAGRPSTRPHAGRQDLLGAAAHRELARRAVRESLVSAQERARPVAVVAEIARAGGRSRGQRHQPADRRLDPDLAGHRQQQRGFSRDNLDLRRHTYRRHRGRRQRRTGHRRPFYAAPGCCDRGVRRISLRGVPGRHCPPAVRVRQWSGSRFAALIEGCRHTRGLGFPERPSIVGKPALERISCLCRRLVAGQ